MDPYLPNYVFPAPHSNSRSHDPRASVALAPQGLQPHQRTVIQNPNSAIHQTHPQQTFYSSPYQSSSVDISIAPSYNARSCAIHQNYTPLPLPSRTFSRPDQLNIHTLFVSGLPDDVKAREIHNIFRTKHGFENSQLKYTGRGNQVVAFATFVDHQSAMSAMNVLNGLIFDPETGATLHIELARSNVRIAQSCGGAYNIIDKRVKVAGDDQEKLSNNNGLDGSDQPCNIDEPSSTTSLDAMSSGFHAQIPLYDKSQGLSSEVPPCSTLFIANLGPTSTEDELKEVLLKYPKFQTLKMQERGGMPVAFADFEDTEASTQAMNELQDSLLPSSDRGGLHVEYAKSKMRKARK